MKIHKVGGTITVPCEQCKSFQQGTFKLRDVPFKNAPSKVAKGIIAGVCDTCDSVCSIPPQASPTINKALKEPRKSVEVRMPTHLLNILELAAFDIAKNKDFSATIVRYYLNQFATGSKNIETLIGMKSDELFSSNVDNRLTVHGNSAKKNLIKLQGATGEKTSTIIRLIALVVHKELLINKDEQTLTQLKMVFEATD